MTTAWAQLPNAAHIDRIIASVKVYTGNWATTRTRNAAWNAAWNEAWNAAWNAVDDAGDVAWNAAWNAVYARMDAAYLVRESATNTACGAILALIAYPDRSRFLDMTPDELHIWAELSEDPGAILLLPAVRVFSEKEIA